MKKILIALAISLVVLCMVKGGKTKPADNPVEKSLTRAIDENLAKRLANLLAAVD